MRVNEAANEPQVIEYKRLEAEAKKLQREEDRANGKEAEALHRLVLQKWKEVHNLGQVIKSNPKIPMRVVRQVKNNV